MSDLKKITLDGIDYVRADQAAPRVTGKRAVLVIDRGWVFAGDVEDKDGRIILTNAIHVRGWSSIGFDGMIANPKRTEVTLKKLSNVVSFPADAELYRVHVSDEWGT